jgi:hypothetical protein
MTAEQNRSCSKSFTKPAKVHGQGMALARYTVKKKVRECSVPSPNVTTKLSLGGNNDVITELFLPRRSLVSDIPAVDGKLVNLFLRCIYCQQYYSCSPACIEYHTNRNIIHSDNLSYVRQWQEDENELLTDGLFHRICFESFEPPEFYFLTV